MQEKYRTILADVAEKYRSMRSMRPIPSVHIAHFLREFAISTTHSSTAIEGNTFTFDETRLLIEKGMTSSARSFREHQEIMGYKQGFDFLYESIKAQAEFTEDLILKIHGFVLLGDERAGKYRDIPVYVGDMFQVVYTPCSAELVPEKMAEYVKRVQADLAEARAMMVSDEIDWWRLFHILARHHIEFEKIHPFPEGNGRTGRLLLSYEMILLGMLPVDIRYEERDRYNAALKAYDTKTKRSTREESATEGMAKLLAECELRVLAVWNDMFASFLK